MNTISSRSSNGNPGGNNGRGKARGRSKKKPLDKVLLRDLALSYAARFATTGAKLEGYLARKIRERGVAEDGDGRSVELDVPALVARLVELGYVDDDAYARAKSRDLTARGYGKRRVEQALWAAGVDEDLRSEHSPDEFASREAAMLLAKRRRFGPFGQTSSEIDEPISDPVKARKFEEKQVAAMLRAGHTMDHVRVIIKAQSAAAVEEWVEEAREDAQNEF